MTEETKNTRKWMARYISGVMTNILYEEDVRNEANKSGIDPDEAIDALEYHQSKLNKMGENYNA